MANIAYWVRMPRVLSPSCISHAVMNYKEEDFTIADLPFISILDKRPKAGQFIMIAWDINGWCGYESTFWDNEDANCKHTVAWLPLKEEDTFTRHCAIDLQVNEKVRPIKLKWSKHYSALKNGKYVSISSIAKVAVKHEKHSIQYSI